MHGRDRRGESNRQSMRGCLWLKTTVGGEEVKKISKIYLAIFGNSAILMEKEQNKWVVCENSFAKGTLRARGFKRNFGVALIAEVISNKDLAAQSWCLFPLSPRC